ncbi:MAG: MauE/DoxX family redox-associated membrane protein [Armatimonadota bacterium]|jgi:putative oxidoreductase
MRCLSAFIANRQVLRIARWLLGAIFIVSALGKIIDPAGFADSIAAYRLLPLYSVNVFALILPWVELLVGFSLLNGVAFQSAALIAAIMNVIFIAAVASAMARGLDIDCGCFTVAESKVGWEIIIRDAVFLAMSLVVLFNRADDCHKPDPRFP